jgi:hypothetical protein
MATLLLIHSHAAKMQPPHAFDSKGIVDSLSLIHCTIALKSVNEVGKAVGAVPDQSASSAQFLLDSDRSGGMMGNNKYYLSL